MLNEAALAVGRRVEERTPAHPPLSALVADRLRPWYDVEFAHVPEADCLAALTALAEALGEAELPAPTPDEDPVRLARRLREHVPPAVVRAGLSDEAADLYSALLDECCLALATILPAPPEEAELALWHLPRTPLDSPGPDAEFRHRYLAHVSVAQDRVPGFGYPVSVAWVSPTASRTAEAEDEHDHVGDTHVSAALAGQPRTLVRGDAGSGKSTLLRWLAVTAARGRFSGGLTAWNGLVPFVVRLRTYAEAELPEPGDWLPPEVAGRAPTGWVHRVLADGGALLLVDGVDELTADRRPRVRRWLRGLLAAYPDLRVVVTARPGAADRGWLDAEGFRALRLEPMAPAEVAEFATRWHQALQHEQPEDFLPQLAERPSLSGSPLLCALAGAVHLAGRKQLPPDRMRLYEAVLEHTEQLEVVQHLAWRMSEAERTELDVEAAVAHVAQALARMPSVALHPATVVHQLMGEGGILHEPVPGRLAFTHRTFQEFLSGKEIADHHLVAELVGRAHLDTWRETAVLAAGHCSVPLRAELLHGLLDRADAERRHARKLRLLAVACLETTRTVPEEAAARVEDVLRRLVPPRDRREVRSLASAGEPVLRTLPSTVVGLPDAVAAACVETAALVNGPAGLRVLARYAADPRISVQQKLALMWRRFDPEEYARQVLADSPLADGSALVHELDQVPHLRHLRHLRWTRLGLHTPVADLDFLASVPRLRSFSARVQPGADTSVLAAHTGLAYLRLHGPCADLAFLSPLTELRTLHVTPAEGLADLWLFAELPRLRELLLSGCPGLADIAGIATLRDLEVLGLGEPQELVDFEPLALLPKLADLRLDRARLPDGLGVLGGVLPRLTRLSLAGSAVADLSPLAGGGLVELNLADSAVRDLAPVAALPRLRRLNLSSTAELDLGPLAEVAEELTVVVRHQQDVRGAERLPPHVRLKRR
ncbi:hypothetical protein JOF53_005432 [Crossiella equi]|uniref:NACHT domain-containing protein n=1 Tax=Crossiella equi TaxID=130796 RepID=A0ABS5ALL2_9PSEU|nr:NACHT domain-containing protein [Crossiella equi]MBP2476560.1 hypothetical protein [Crossiella equi]